MIGQRKQHHDRGHCAHGEQGRHRGWKRRFAFGHHAHLCCGMWNHGAAYTEETQQIQGEIAEGADTCPLCDKHCPLSAPGCGRGRAYARTI